MCKTSFTNLFGIKIIQRFKLTSYLFNRKIQIWYPGMKIDIENRLSLPRDRIKS